MGWTAGGGQAGWKTGWGGLAVALMLNAGAQASEGGDTEAMQAALAAGYKATFTCSVLFNAGRDLDSVAANELTGAYPAYRDHVEGLPDAEVDEDLRTVAVGWSETLPPRIAAWRPGFGCSQLPIGAGADMVSELPRHARWHPPALEPETATKLSPDASPATAADPAGLDAVVTAAFGQETYGAGDSKTSGVVILRDGTILAERYAHGITATTSQRTWSVAKSVSATVIGAAVHQGIIAPTDPAGLTAWSAPGDPRADITLANLLHMASGLDSGTAGNRTDRLYFGGGRAIDLAATKSMEVAPGSRFKYANNDTVLAMRALREAIGNDAVFHAFPYESVLWKIGALRTVLETDWNGDFLSSSQVFTTARDMARLGQLYLQDGMWDGERLLAEGWAAYVATPAPSQPERAWGYGAQFWLPNGADGLPDDAYMAAGHRGQYIVIIPSANTVVVRRGFDESGGGGFAITRFAADVLTALNEAPTE